MHQNHDYASFVVDLFQTVMLYADDVVFLVYF